MKWKCEQRKSNQLIVDPTSYETYQYIYFFPRKCVHNPLRGIPRSNGNYFSIFNFICRSYNLGTQPHDVFDLDKTIEGGEVGYDGLLVRKDDDCVRLNLWKLGIHSELALGG